MADPKYSEEVRTMLTEGKRYVEHIRACNDVIPDVEISAKISRLELIISRIFTQVEKDPSLAAGASSIYELLSSDDPEASGCLSGIG